VVAWGITAAGTKVPVGLWESDTENRTVVKHLLADLAERGLEADDGLLVVIGGAKGPLTGGAGWNAPAARAAEGGRATRAWAVAVDPGSPYPGVGNAR
jgi:hypothetical protein